MTDKDIYFPIPQQARTISSLDEISDVHIGDIEVLVSVKGKSLKMKLKEFYNPWHFFIGQYVSCASNIYDFNTIVPCLGGEIYAEDFEYGLDVLGERVPQNWVFKEKNTVTHIQLPDLRDRIIQFDPQLSYGFLEDEGVAEDFVDQFEGFSEHQYQGQKQNQCLDTGFVCQHFDTATDYNGYMSGSINVPSYSLDDVNMRGLVVLADPNIDIETIWIQPHKSYSSSLYSVLGLKGTQMFEFVKRNISISLNKYNNYVSYSGSWAEKKLINQFAIDKNNIQVGQKTRESTINAMIGLFTGSIKRNEKKKFWLVDATGRGLLTETENIFLIKSTKDPSKSVGENTAIMKNTAPEEIHPFILKRLYDEKNPSDPMGVVLMLDKETRAEKLPLEKFFSDISLTFLLNNKEKKRFSFSTNSEGNLIFTANEHKMIFKFQDYTLDKKTYTVTSKITQVFIQKDNESEVSLSAPDIEIAIANKNDVMQLELFYNFKGFQNNLSKILATRKPLDKNFFQTLMMMNTSEKNLIEKTFASFSFLGIKNIFNPKKSFQFHFKMKDSLFLKNSYNQEDLALEFKEACFKGRENTNFYNAFRNKSTTPLSDFVDFDENIFIMEGRKMKFVYDFSDNEHWLGFQYIPEDGEEDKEYALLFTKYNAPESETNLNIPFSKVLSETGELEKKDANVKALKFNVHNDTRLAITEKPFKTKYDFVIDTIETPIMMVARNKILMISIPAIDSSKMKQKVYNSWSDSARITQEQAKKTMEKLPYFLENTTCIDDIDSQEKDKKGLFNQGGENTRFYFKMK